LHWNFSRRSYVEGAAPAGRFVKTGRHAFNPKALKALGVDPAVARELGYALKVSKEPELNLAA
jgi:hypothetical protein